MVGYFLDTSALVKRYVDEAGSETVLGLCDRALRHEIVIASIAEVELVSAIRRRVREGGLSASDAATIYEWFKEDFSQHYEVRMLDPAVIGTAVGLLAAHALRAYDAIQLASGLVTNQARADRGIDALVFVTADRDLAAVAQEVEVETMQVG